MVKDLGYFDKEKKEEPKYMIIYETIKREINEGIYKPKDKIPSEKDLSNRFDVSRTTVRLALGKLVEDNWLYTQQGKGTFVTDRNNNQVINQSLQSISNFSHTIMEKGYKAGTELIGVTDVISDMKLSKFLGVDIGLNIIQMRLLGMANKVPVVLYESYFEESLGVEILAQARRKIDQKMAFSTIDLYNEIDTVKPHCVDQTFEAIAASEKIAELLRIKIGDPLVFVTSIIYSKANKPIEYRKAYYLSDKYRFYIRRML